MWGLAASQATVGEYYRSAAVRQRIREYCGLTSERVGPIRFLAAQTGRDGRATWDDEEFCPPGSLDRMLMEGADVSRSQWDRGGFLFFLDLDYLNPDHPEEPFAHPIETFFKLEPAYRAVRDSLRDFGLASLDVLTGEGYHFTGHLPATDALFGKLAGLAAAVPPWHSSQAARAPLWGAFRMDERTARAFAGYGLVLEFLALEVLRRAAATSEIPVVLDSTVVGAGSNGRECVSIDLSHLAAPLDIRHVRTAFSAYQKHRFRPDIYGRSISERIPACAAIIRNGSPLLSALAASRNLKAAARLAEQSSAVPPDLSEGMSRLVDRYQESSLRGFHDEFYSTPPDPARAGADLRKLRQEAPPPCITASLDQPNDLLLRPEHMQHLTRYLLSLGWPPRRISGLIRGVYEEDHGWGNRWMRMSPEWRADVYVRGFAGMIAVGADHAIDFNCVSTREKGMCPGGCSHNLADDRATLLAGKAS